MIKREFDMRRPVKNWLFANGYLSAVEFWLHHGGITDIVAGRYAERTSRSIPKLLDVMAIELKMHDVSGVLGQAIANSRVCASYAAMPTERIRKMRGRTIERFERHGIGLLAVDSHVTPVLTAKSDVMNITESARKQLWRRVRQYCQEVV